MTIVDLLQFAGILATAGAGYWVQRHKGQLQSEEAENTLAERIQARLEAKYADRMNALEAEANSTRAERDEERAGREAVQAERSELVKRVEALAARCDHLDRQLQDRRVGVAIVRRVETGEHLYEYINEVGAEMNGRSSEEHFGHAVEKLFPEFENLLDVIDRVIDTGEPFEDRILDRNGNLWDAVFVRVVRYDTGEPMCAYARFIGLEIPEGFKPKDVAA